MNFLDAKVKVNGNDVTLTVGKYNMKLPASKAKAVIDGGYDGKTVVMGILRNRSTGKLLHLTARIR